LAVVHFIGYQQRGHQLEIQLIKLAVVHFIGYQQRGHQPEIQPVKHVGLGNLRDRASITN
jgi:cephalosporin-C deacetylase-like acetyl esterase